MPLLLQISYVDGTFLMISCSCSDFGHWSLEINNQAFN